MAGIPELELDRRERTLVSDDDVDDFERSDAPPGPMLCNESRIGRDLAAYVIEEKNFDRKRTSFAPLCRQEPNSLLQIAIAIRCEREVIRRQRRVERFRQCNLSFELCECQ